MAARKPPEAPPPTQIEALERSLAGKAGLARGYVVRGEERWFREAALALLVQAAARGGVEVARHDGADPDLDLSALQGDLASPPLFAPARLVLVRHAAVLLEKKSGADSPFSAAALAFLRAPAVAGALAPVPGTLAIEGESLRADGAVAKAIVAAGGTLLTLRRLYDTPPPWGGDPDPRRVELVQWLLARARAKELQLDAGEAAYVAAATGNDLGALDGALDALAQGSARRGARGLRESVGWTGAVSPFQLADDLARGDAAASLAGIEGLFRSGMRARDGSREVKPEAALAVLFGSLKRKLREGLAAARAEGAGAGDRWPGGEAAWLGRLDDLAELERRTRTRGTVDASDLALLALRWRRVPSGSTGARIAPAMRPAVNRGGGR